MTDLLLASSQLAIDHHGNTQDLIRGKRPMKIGVVGGSISFGSGTSRIGIDDWFSILSRSFTAYHSTTKARSPIDLSPFLSLSA